MLPSKELANYWVSVFMVAFSYWLTLVLLLIFYSIDPRFIINSNFLCPIPLSLKSISPWTFSIFSRISTQIKDYSPIFSISRMAWRFLRLSSSQSRLRYSRAFLFSLISLMYSLCCYQKAQMILVYFLVSNISSKMALRLAESEKGQRDQSWWQKTMFSRTDFEMPKSCGICFSIQAQWWFISNISPFSSFVFRVCSIDSNLFPLLVRVSRALRFASTGRPLKALNFKRVSPIISVCPIIFGSITKFLPLSQVGGSAPVVMYLRTSMMVQDREGCTVFPEPFLPQMRVRGVSNSIFSSSRGEQLLKPAIPKASNTDMIQQVQRCNRAREVLMQISRQKYQLYALPSPTLSTLITHINIIYCTTIFLMESHLNESAQDPIHSRYKSIESDDTRNPTTNKKNQPGQFQRSPYQQHHSRVPRIVEDLLPIKEKLDQMQSRKFQYLKLGNYKRAEKMGESIRRTKSLLGKQQIAKIVANQTKEKRSITVAHKKQMHYLHQLWSDYFYRLRQREAQILHSFKLTQQEEIQSARQKLQTRCKSLRDSRDIIELKEQEKYFHWKGNHEELRYIRKQIKKAAVKEEANRTQLISHWAQVEENRLSVSQSKKYNALMSRLQEYREDKQKIYRREQKRLKQKYKNVLAQLEHDQTLQLYYAKRLISFDNEVRF